MPSTEEGPTLRRLTVNPHDLRTVPDGTRWQGDPLTAHLFPTELLLCILTSGGGFIQRISLHRLGCPRAPKDGYVSSRTSPKTWAVTVLERDEAWERLAASENDERVFPYPPCCHGGGIGGVS